MKRHGFWGIGTEPEFAIGQRALLLQSPGGNLLWDCISLLDDETIAEVNARGGIRAIAISHPHFYSSMIEWAECFDAQIFLHSADREWVMRKSPRIQFWEGSTLSLWDGLTLINCGGHFEGGTVLHWPTGANGKGALLTGDIITVVQDRRYVSFLRSYPNLIPLGASAIRRHRRKNRTFLIRADLWRLVAGERSCRMQKQPLRDPPNAICAGSARRSDIGIPMARGCTGLVAGAASSSRQLAATASQPIGCRHGSCRMLRSSLCSQTALADQPIHNSRQGDRSAARAPTASRIVRAAFPQDSLR